MKTHKNLYAHIGSFENLLLAAHKAAQGKRFRPYVLKFLGQIVFPTHRLLPPENVRRFARRMRRFQKDYASRKIALPEIRRSLRSWLGHAGQAGTWALRRDLMPRLAKFTAAAYIA